MRSKTRRAPAKGAAEDPAEAQQGGRHPRCARMARAVFRKQRQCALRRDRKTAGRAPSSTETAVSGIGSSVRVVALRGVFLWGRPEIGAAAARQVLHRHLRKGLKLQRYEQRVSIEIQPLELAPRAASLPFPLRLSDWICSFAAYPSSPLFAICEEKCRTPKNMISSCVLIKRWFSFADVVVF
jgi:hypothetical protein